MKLLSQPCWKQRVVEQDSGLFDVLTLQTLCGKGFKTTPVSVESEPIPFFACILHVLCMYLKRGSMLQRFDFICILKNCTAAHFTAQFRIVHNKSTNTVKTIKKRLTKIKKKPICPSHPPGTPQQITHGLPSPSPPALGGRPSSLRSSRNLKGVCKMASSMEK